MSSDQRRSGRSDWHEWAFGLASRAHVPAICSSQLLLFSYVYLGGEEALLALSHNETQSEQLIQRGKPLTHSLAANRQDAYISY